MGKRSDFTPPDKKPLEELSIEELEAELEGLKKEVKRQRLALRQTEYDMETIRSILVFRKAQERQKD